MICTANPDILFIRQDSKKRSSMVAALSGKWPKISTFPGRKKRKGKETEGKGKEGKDVKGGKERDRMRQHIGKEEDRVYEETEVLGLLPRP